MSKNKADYYLRQHLEDILEYGELDVNPRPKYADGTPAHTKFITQVFEKYCMDKGDSVIPTLRPTAVKSGIKEMLWIYQKASNELSVAHEMGINWWDEWSIGDGTIGAAYGDTIAKYNSMDKLLGGLSQNPYGRRHILSMWQEEQIRLQDSIGGLNPCAFMSMWSVRGNRIDCTLIMRSSDRIVAGAINISQYVALAQAVCSHLNTIEGRNGVTEEYKVGNFALFTQNLHLYDRHVNQAEELLARESTNRINKFYLKKNKLFWELTIDDWVFDIESHPPLETKLELAI